MASSNPWDEEGWGTHAHCALLSQFAAPGDSSSVRSTTATVASLKGGVDPARVGSSVRSPTRDETHGEGEYESKGEGHSDPCAPGSEEETRRYLRAIETYVGATKRKYDHALQYLEAKKSSEYFDVDHPDSRAATKASLDALAQHASDLYSRRRDILSLIQSPVSAVNAIAVDHEHHGSTVSFVRTLKHLDTDVARFDTASEWAKVAEIDVGALKSRAEQLSKQLAQLQTVYATALSVLDGMRDLARR